jgi:hypothetical protein
VSAGAAIAVWTISGVGSGQAAARTLSAPTSVTATCASTTSVRVDWQAAQFPPYIDTYRVARSANGGGSWTNVGSLVTATTATSYSLTDAPGNGTYVWRVTANKGTNWRTNSANSNSRTLSTTLLLLKECN